MTACQRERAESRGTAAGRPLPVASSPRALPAPADALEQPKGAGGVSGAVEAAGNSTAHRSWVEPLPFKRERTAAGWDIGRSNHLVRFEEPSAFDFALWRASRDFKALGWHLGERAMEQPVTAGLFCLACCAGVVGLGILAMLPLAFVGK